jgi:hypothetical protein
MQLGRGWREQRGVSGAGIEELAGLSWGLGERGAVKRAERATLALGKGQGVGVDECSD